MSKHLFFNENSTLEIIVLAVLFLVFLKEVTDDVINHMLYTYMCTRTKQTLSCLMH